MRILIVKLTSLGDVIHTLPAVTDLKAHYPDAKIDWLVEESFSSIPRWHPAVGQVLEAASRRWRSQPGKFPVELLKLVRRAREPGYDMVIDAQGLLKSALLARLVPGERVGFDRSSIKEPAASMLYTRGIAVDRNMHAVLRTRALFAGALGYGLDDGIEYGVDAGKFPAPEFSDPYLVFLHATTWRSKQWPLEHWRRLSLMAAGRGYRVLLPWGSDEEQSRAREISRDNTDVVVCPRMTLDQVAGMIAHAAGVVAVDTGLGHLAAALSRPCISLYGATDSRRTGTIGARQQHLQASFRCSPCLSRTCTYPGQSAVEPACFAQFPPERVWQSLETLIQEG